MTINLAKLVAGLRDSLPTNASAGSLGTVPTYDYAILEKRVLFSAAPVDTADFELLDLDHLIDGEADHFGDDFLSQIDQDLANDRFAFDSALIPLGFGEFGYAASDSELATPLIVIDANVVESNELVADLLASHNGNVEILQLDAARDGIEQIADAVAGKSISALHIVSHGEGGGVQLGNALLHRDNLTAYAGRIASWGLALEVDADVLFYGCDLASNEAGRELIESISSLCDCDVAASDDLTGHEDLGGDWDFEFVVGEVDTDVVFSQSLQQRWFSTLATITVDTTLDEVDGDTSNISALLASSGGTGISLREAIIAANNTAGADTISLATGSYNLTRTGSGESFAATGDLDIRSDITITGAGAAQTTISASGLGDRIFDITSAGDLTLNSLSVADANTSSSGGAINNAGVLSAYDVVIRDITGGATGGAIENSGNVTLERVSLYDNSATSFGGAIRQTSGTLSLTNVVLSGNNANTHGGAVFLDGGTANVNHSTFAENVTSFNTGGFIVSSGSATIANSIFADNTGGGSFTDDISGTVTSNGFNILEDYSGFSANGNDITGSYSVAARTIDPTTGHAYHAITPGDAAVDAAGGSSPATDILGATRDANPDIGATEYIPPPPDLVTTSTNGGGLSVNDDGGNDAYLEADTSPFNAEGQVTVEVDFKVDTPATGLTTLLSYATGSNQDELYVGIDSGGEVFFRTSSNSGSGYGSTTHAPQLLDGNRHTLTVTWNSTGGILLFYVDGEQLGLGRNNYQPGSAIDSGGTLVIGQHQTTPGAGFDTDNTFEGTIYSARLFSDLRTEAEIADNYRSDVPFDEAGLIANWRFDGLSTNGVVTESVAGNNLTVMHTAEVGFSASDPSLTFSIDEDSLDGTIVGTVSGVDAERDAQIASLLTADSDLRYSAETGKFYKLVSGSTTWSSASTAALGTSLNSVNGQLVAIRSAVEQGIVESLASSAGNDLWIGATDDTVEGEHRWTQDGAESDQFWQGDGTGYNIDGAYANWLAGRPDNSGGNQNFVFMRPDGFWNEEDAFHATAGYVVEWDADAVLDATQALTYEIQSQTVDGAFEIDADTGEIRVLDGSLLDYETNATHTLTVRTTDVDDNTYDEAFSVSLVNNSPIDLSSGIELNSDGGNDTYLVADDGGAILGSLNQFTFETTFTLESGSQPTFLSYASPSQANEVNLFVDSGGFLTIHANGGYGTTTVPLAELSDGDIHQLAFSWDNLNGDWFVYLDGEHADSGSGLAAGASLDAGGTLLFGQEQDSLGGGFESDEAFQGTLYDVRIWDAVRSEAEIALNYQQKFDIGSLPTGLVANWQMDGFNGSTEVVDVVSGNNLSIGHATGTGFTASTPVEDLRISEHATNGASVGYAVPSDPDVSNDVVSDGLFTEGTDPGTNTRYTTGQTFGDWRVESGDVDHHGTIFADSPLGGHSVGLNGSTTGAISQDLATEAGSHYQVVFALSGEWDGGDATKDLRVSAGGEASDFSINQPSGWTDLNPIWDPRSFTFTADGPISTLQFTSLDSGSDGPVIADVQVIEVPAAVTAILNSDPSLSYDAGTGKFYRFVNTTDGFNTQLAAATGANLNGVSGGLVRIDSQYENELIRQFAISSGNDVWLGATDADNDGDWSWLNGTTESSDQFWTGGSGGSAEPGFFAPTFGQSESAGEDFVRMNTDGTWADDTVGSNHAYVIEWDASQVLSNFTFTLTDASNNFEINAITGEITVSATNTLDYEADTSHDVTVEVTDSLTNTYSEVLTITVENVNEVLSAVNDSITTNEDALDTFNPLTNDSSEIGDTNTILEVTQPNNGTAVNNGNGTISYTPDGDYNGADSFEYIATNSDAGLQHYWGLDGDAVDAIGGADGTLTGTTTVAGDFGNGMEFNESSDYVTLPDVTYNSEFTISFEFKVDEITGSLFQYLYSHGDINNTNSISVFLNEETHGSDPNVLRTVVRDANDTLDNAALQVDISNTGLDLVDSQFHTYTLTASSNGLEVFIDGVSVATDTTRGTDGINPSGNAYLGVRQDLDANRMFGGVLDSVQIYSNALAAIRCRISPRAAIAPPSMSPLMRSTMRPL